MTLLINGYTITGTPEEISTFIKIYKQKDTDINISNTSYAINSNQHSLWYRNYITENSVTNTAITTEIL